MDQNPLIWCVFGTVCGNMSRKVNGFCLKCKTYGEIIDCRLDLMKNGRTRAHGICSQKGCAGKISKIVS